MKLRLLIKGDAIQYGENDFYCPCRTIDVNIADNLIDKEHEHIIGVEVEPQESNEDSEENNKYSTKPYPVAGMRVKFKTTEGKTHTGIYDFNIYSQRRWFDENNYEYTSDMIDEWEEIEVESIKVVM